MISRRRFVSGLALTATSPLWSGIAQASTAYGLTTEELVRRAERVSLATPVERHATWMTLAGSRRIVTLHRIVETERLDSDASPEESWVLTLGGRVGDLGQKVSGEAEIQTGHDFVLFMGSERIDGEVPPYRRVIGMAQGAYRMMDEGGRRRMRPSQDIPHLVPPRAGRLAIEDLGGLDVEGCKAQVRRFR